jgi:hypothetical protein
MYKKKVIPVTIGATGTISQSFRKYLSNIAGRHEIKSTENSHIEHCTRASGSADVKVQNI